MGDRPARDERRDAWLEAQRIHVYRINAPEVLCDPDAVAQAIVQLVLERPPQSGCA
jgi:very-short-patch-repair endonuclease